MQGLGSCAALRVQGFGVIRVYKTAKTLNPTPLTTLAKSEMMQFETQDLRFRVLGPCSI